MLVLALDRERERISLGLKQTKPKPWETAQVNYPVGSICEGKVVRIVTFGALWSWSPGLDGPGPHLPDRPDPHQQGRGTC